MIKISISSKQNVNESKIKNAVLKTLQSNKVENAEISIMIVDKKQMAKYAGKYYKKDKREHPVLAFPNKEVKPNFVFPPNTSQHLGEIVLVGDKDDKLAHWASHATLHLLGIHHD